MAYGTNVGQDLTYNSSGDNSANQFRFMKMLSTSTSGLAPDVSAAAGAAGEAVVGVLQNDPTANQAATVRTAGRTKIVCGGSVSIGNLLTSDSVGRAIAYTKATVFTGTPYIVSGSMVLGIAEQAGSTGQTIDMLYSPRGFSS